MPLKAWVRLRPGLGSDPAKPRALVAAFHQAAYPAWPEGLRFRKLVLPSSENAGRHFVRPWWIFADRMG